MIKYEFFIPDRELATAPYHYTECGLDNVYLLNGFEIREVAGEQAVCFEDLDTLHMRIARHLLIHDWDKLTAQEQRFLCAELDTHLPLKEPWHGGVADS